MRQNVNIQKLFWTGTLNTIIVLISLLFLPDPYYIFPWIYLVGTWLILIFRFVILPLLEE